MSSRQRLLDRVDVAPARILDPARAADVAVLRERHVRRPSAASIAASSASDSLKPSGPNSLMPLSCVGIVAGGDHHAEVGAHLAGEHARPPGSAAARSGSRPCPTLVNPATSAVSIM